MQILRERYPKITKRLLLDTLMNNAGVTVETCARLIIDAADRRERILRLRGKIGQ
jgi:hypothetical protein